REATADAAVRAPGMLHPLGHRERPALAGRRRARGLLAGRRRLAGVDDARGPALGDVHGDVAPGGVAERTRGLGGARLLVEPLDAGDELPPDPVAVASHDAGAPPASG